MLSNNASVCLQINLAPSDFRMASHTIPHQMRTFANQVSEIQFTLDARPQKSSKYRLDDFDKTLSSLKCLLNDFCLQYPNAHIKEVDFSELAIRKISDELHVVDNIPISALNGSPFFGYIFGIYEAKSDFVLHLDSDMLFGGRSNSWVAEAIAALQSDPRILVVNPLAGPPTHNGTIRQKYVERLHTANPSYTFATISSRFIFAERKRLLFEHPLPILAARGERRLRALINNMPAVDAYEDCLSSMLANCGLLRLDMLGANGGLWSLHPPYRSETFYARLPELIKQIESGVVPEKQRGDYNINDSMINWSEARRQKEINRISRYIAYVTKGLIKRESHP